MLLNAVGKMCIKKNHKYFTQTAKSMLIYVWPLPPFYYRACNTEIDKLCAVFLFGSLENKISIMMCLTSIGNSIIFSMEYLLFKFNFSIYIYANASWQVLWP